MLGEALKQLRLFHGVKQKDLAEAINVSPSYLSEIEKGRKDNITIELVNKYADFFGVRNSDLFMFSEKLSEQTSQNPANRKVARKALKIMAWISSQNENDAKAR